MISPPPTPFYLLELVELARHRALPLLVGGARRGGGLELHGVALDLHTHTGRQAGACSCWVAARAGGDLGVEGWLLGRSGCRPLGTATQ
eukprot:COSAG01_NODE_2851_length_6937_cov_13.682228_11_plen_89_part_00